MENLTLFDIAKGISWTDEKKIFFVQNKQEDSVIIEYLNDVSLSDIETEIGKLEKFNSLPNITEKKLHS